MNYKVAIKTGLCVKIYDRRFSLSIYTTYILCFFVFAVAAAAATDGFGCVACFFSFERAIFPPYTIPFVFVHAFHERL